MKHELLRTLRVVVLAMVTFTVSRARAQTVAPGPYYPSPSWAQNLACNTLATCPRFTVLSNSGRNDSVLDIKTGPVWERSPESANFPMWDAARLQCMQKRLGGRMDWRLPAVHELASLVDPSAPRDLPSLPAGHPFTGVQAEPYWSATRDASKPILVWAVQFFGDSTLHAREN